MASEQATVSPAVAPVFPPALAEAPATLPTTSIDSEPTRTKSLKRGRQLDTSSPKPTPYPGLSTVGLSPSAKSPRLNGGFTPSPMTGAAAIEDMRRIQEESGRQSTSAMSENPGHKALSSLMAGGGARISRPQDAPASTSVMSEGMSIAATALNIPHQMHGNERIDTSPASVTSLANLGTAAQTATASPTFVASPGAIGGLSDSESRAGNSGDSRSLRAPAEEQSNRGALSYPGHMLQQPELSRTPQRGLSLPMPGQQLAPRSPSQKKHKCPYCETEFTRHHNLKSHLLTHSHEKPYVCQTCNMRFRRLHDLKRHMKLHTGERPHVCPKCDRKFARGDALARHSKGQGGCAGRRPSMGSFGGDDDYQGSNGGDEEDMEGISYTNGAPHGNEADMTEEERRRASLPSINAQHVSGHKGSQDNYNPHNSRTPSTYPPAGPRPVQPSGGLYPPNIDRGSGSSAASPSMQNSYPGHTPGGSMSSMALSTGPGSMYAQSAMTESPKPLSPAGMQTHQLGHDPGSLARQRSPSLTTQFQQQHFGRRQTGRDSPTGMSLPSPLERSQGPKLPALAGLAPPEGRFTLNSQTPTQQNPNGGQGQSTASSPSSLFQPPRSAGPSQQSSSGDSSKNLFASGEQGVWAYVQTLEEQVKDLTNKLLGSQNRESAAHEQISRQQNQIKSLTEEANYLRTQLASQQGQQPPASTQA